MIQSVKKFEADNILCSYYMTLSDGKVWSVPINEENTDYQDILEWEKIEGNTIEEAD
jgi:hypothetical protein